MKLHFKLTSAMLSAVMCMSMMATPVTVIADEAAAPEETQATEVTKKEETKETEKPAAKETEEKKPEAAEKETESSEKTEPSETEKHETEATESQKPSETEKQEPETTEKETEPAEKTEPSETEKAEPETSESEEPAQTEATTPENKYEQTPEVARRKAKNEVSINKTKDNTFLGTNKMANPAAPSNIESSWTGSYVYFGKYDGKPIKFRVLSKSSSAYKTNALFLDSDSVLLYRRFDESSNEWANSEIRSYLNGEFLKGFTREECSAIATSKGDGGLSYSATTWEKLNYGSPVSINDQVFLLDASEVLNPEYGYIHDSGHVIIGGGSYPVPNRDKEPNPGKQYVWWLRSKAGKYAGCAHEGLLYYQQVEIKESVAPALNVDLDDIVFSTVTSGTIGKTGAEYKLTLKDSRLSIAVPVADTATYSGTTITIPYKISGDNKAYANRVSVLILRRTNHNVLYYDALNVSSISDGIGTFTLPSDLSFDDWGAETDTGYIVYILAEQANKSQTTDYASEKYEVKKPVLYSSLEFNVGKGAFYYDKDDQIHDDNNETGGTVVLSKTTVHPGDKVTITVSPKSGYALKKIELFTDGAHDITAEKSFTVGTIAPTIFVYFQEQVPNTVSAKGKTAKVKYKKLRKKAQTVARYKVINVSAQGGDITYKLTGVKRGKSKKYKKYFKINAKTGNVTVKKKLKKGTYKITCKVTAGNYKYMNATKTITFKIKVK